MFEKLNTPQDVLEILEDDIEVAEDDKVKALQAEFAAATPKVAA